MNRIDTGEACRDFSGQRWSHGSCSIKRKNTFEGYKKNEIIGLTPLQLILKLYDYVIVNSKRRDLSKVSAGLTQSLPP